MSKTKSLSSTERNEAVFKSRRQKIIRQLHSQIAIFSSNPQHVQSRDREFPFQPNSDLFYLCGIEEPQSVLILKGGNKGPRSILYLRERNPEFEKWNGELLGLKRAKKHIAVDEVRDIKQLPGELLSLVEGCHTVYYSPGTEPELDRLIWGVFCTAVAPRLNKPHTLRDARLLTAELRFVKDKLEIEALRHAAEITARAFQLFLPELPRLTSEKHAARVLESIFARLGAHGTAFDTIIASGKNATTLHHKPKLQPLWKRELLLIDAGAQFKGYAGDITRTVPVSGKFSEAQAEVYDVVANALEAARAACRPGNTLDEIHHVAVKQLTKGLIDLGILKGSTQDNISQAKYRPYFMHRTSHWLGLDVHDIAPVTLNVPGTSSEAITTSTITVPSHLRPLVPGNVFTLEPGLYFDAEDESIPLAYRGIGIRLEDDVLITSSGASILTESLAFKREDIEELMQAASSR